MHVRQTGLSLAVLIEIVENENGFTGPCRSFGVIPRCAAVNEIGVIWCERNGASAADIAQAENALIGRLADKDDGVRFNALAYLLESPQFVSPEHAMVVQAFVDDPKNAEGVKVVRGMIKRNHVAVQAATS